MTEPTPTETRGIYTGPDQETPVALIFPLIMPERGREATPTTWDQKYVAGKIYEVDVSRRFQQLVGQWSEETLYMSSIEAMVARPSYLEIVGMGEKVVPLLLRELEKTPNHWFSALTAITGENPISEEARGRLIEMTEAWLEWGRDKDYF